MPDVTEQPGPPNDLSPEQQIAWVILARELCPEAATQIIRYERVFSYTLGAHLAPILHDLATRYADLASRYAEIDEEPGD